MLKRFGLAVLLSILGGILGLAAVIVFIWDWFGADWQQIEAAPEPVANLVLIERDQLWAESESGTLYKYTDAENCQSNCWTVVMSVPDPVWYDNPDPVKVKDRTCSPALPLFKVEERIEQCRIEKWVNKNYIFALRKSGRIYFWQSDVYGEWLVVELFLGLCAGTICLSVPAFFFTLLPGTWKRFSKKQEKLQNST